jgi:regulator of sigma E protease
MSAGILTSIAAFIVAIGILVTVHEFGHFWVARRLGFKVLRFSIGFGKPLLTRVSRDADQVEYVLAAIPLGGYVRLLDERDGPVPPGDEHRAFNRRPPLARIAVLLAGPGANLVFAVLAYWLLFMQGVPGLKPVLGEIAPGSIAARADLRTGDEITSVAGVATGTRQSAVLGILEGVVESGRVPLEVRGEGGATRRLTLEVPDAERRTLTEPGVLLSGLGFSFWYPQQPVVVGELSPGFPAAEAGILAGDRIVELEGAPVDDYRKFVSAIRERAGLPTRLVVLRDDRRLDIEVVPRAVEEEGRTIGKIGLASPTISGSWRWSRSHSRC